MRRRRRKKICNFCANKVRNIDFKETKYLQKYLTDRGKILPRRITGNCSDHQRQLTRAIKRSRIMALLPFSQGE